MIYASKDTFTIKSKKNVKDKISVVLINVKNARVIKLSVKNAVQEIG